VHRIQGDCDVSGTWPVSAASASSFKNGSNGHQWLCEATVHSVTPAKANTGTLAGELFLE